jgi:metal-responsive CopG/Arc/MetJ family transcriptional regulator
MSTGIRDALQKPLQQRVTIRVTEELLDDVDRLVEAGHCPSRSAAFRRAIARYLNGRPR